MNRKTVGLPIKIESAAFGKQRLVSMFIPHVAVLEMIAILSMVVEELGSAVIHPRWMASDAN